MKWLDNVTFDMDGYKITLDYQHGGSRRESQIADFTMMKSRDFLDEYIKHQNERFDNVLELGVYQGGSFVFLDKLYKPIKISAVEISRQLIPALDAYVSENSERARIYYGTSQDDRVRISEIINNDFNGVLDLVVDDASHFYEQTKASFAVAFPKLRPGGLYIIEDWSWSFQAPYQVKEHPWSDRNSLANLVIDLMEDMVLNPMIADIYICRSMLKVRRSSVVGNTVFGATARRDRDFKLL